MAGAIVRTVSKNTICKVVATCCGELAESTEMLIPGIGVCAYRGMPTQKMASRKKLCTMNLKLSGQETAFEQVEKLLLLNSVPTSSLIFDAKRGM
jgi:hypothetical protein